MTAQPPAVGAYLVDEGTAVASPSEPPWVGKMQRVAGDGRYALITATGYEWPVHPSRVRPATDAERATFERDAETLRSEVAAALRLMERRPTR